MKIQAINNNQNQYKTKTNFMGNVILPEKLSVNAERFIQKSFEKISKLVEKTPYDIYVKEVAPKEKEAPAIVFMVKDTKEDANLPKQAVIDAISILIEEPKVNKEEVLEFKMPSISIREISEQLLCLKNKKHKNKYYVPSKIGSPQKPYTKRRRY